MNGFYAAMLVVVGWKYMTDTLRTCVSFNTVQKIKIAYITI